MEHCQQCQTPDICQSYTGCKNPPAKENADDRLALMACSPLRVAYSRAELADKLKDWMIELWGDTPKNLDPEERDRWHRDNGLIYHFICDHFPTENDQEEARRK